MTTTTTTALNEYKIERDNGKALRFKGTLLATASSHRDNCYGRWTYLELYRTAKGKYIAVSQAITQWEGESNIINSEVFETEKEVMDFFGDGWLARKIYSDAGFDYFETVE